MAQNDFYVGESGRVTGTIVNPVTGAGFQPETLSYAVYARGNPNVAIIAETALTPIATYVTVSGVIQNFNLPVTATALALTGNTTEQETHVLWLKATWSSGADVVIEEVPFNVNPDGKP